MKRLKHIVILFVVLVIIVCTVTAFKLQNLGCATIKRDDRSIYNDKGYVLAEQYFDYVQLKSHTPAALIINQYFESEKDGFFSDSNELNLYEQNRRQIFEDYFFRYLSAHGETDFLTMPFVNKVDTVIVYESSELLSVLETTDWLAGGSRSTYSYGRTFDVVSGELLTPERFVSCDIQTFNENVISQLFVSLSEEQTVNPRKEMEIRDKYTSYSYEDYEFYYDGKNLFIIFNEDIYHGKSFILRLREI